MALSNEWSGSDEPYFIIFAADFAALASSGRHRRKVTMHAWGDADKGETLKTLTSDEVPVELHELIRSGSASVSETSLRSNGRT